MRCLALVSLLLLIAALVLNVLLLISGTKPGLLENMDILTLNTSDIGSTLATSSSSPVQSAISGAVNGNPVASAVVAANPQASSLAESIVSSQANSIAQAVGLHDFYSFHIQNYCEGYYDPSPTAANATKNVTSCSNSTALWSQNLTQILQSELKAGYVVSQLKIPEQVTDAFATLQTGFHVQYIFYWVTLAVTCVGILGAVAALILDGRISACLMFFWTLLAAAASLVAGGLATAIAYAGSSAIESYQSEVGAQAYKGTLFLGMTWALSAALIIATLLWSVDCCVGGKDRRRYGRYRNVNQGRHRNRQSDQAPMVPTLPMTSAQNHRSVHDQPYYGPAPGNTQYQQTAYHQGGN